MQTWPRPLLEIHRHASVDVAAVETERREDREGNIFLVRRIDAADRGRTRPEWRAVGIDVEQIVRADREFGAVASLEAELEVGDPLGAEEYVVRSEGGEAGRGRDRI